MLVLPIKKKWFDMIISGEKKEEYREMKKYYDQKLYKYFGGSRTIKRNILGLQSNTRNACDFTKRIQT